MILDDSLLNEESFQEGAFMLMSCSSLSRYKEMAKYMAESSGLRERLDSGEISISDVIERGRDLWQEIQRIVGRGLEEVELASILGAIADRASDEITDFIISIALADFSQGAWLSASARSINQERPVDNEDEISPGYYIFRLGVRGDSTRSTRRISPHNDWNYMKNSLSTNYQAHLHIG